MSFYFSCWRVADPHTQQTPLNYSNNVYLLFVLGILLDSISSKTSEVRECLKTTGVGAEPGPGAWAAPPGPGSLRYGVCRVLVSFGEQGGPGERVPLTLAWLIHCLFIRHWLCAGLP